MTNSVKFTSAIGPSLARFLAHKQALGRKYDSQRQQLVQLDRFLTMHSASDLDAESFSAWCSSTRHLMPSGRRMQMLLVRRFCLFRRRSEPNCFVPDPSQFPPPQPRIPPYIFSEAEIVRLLHAADALQPCQRSPLRPQVARLALVLFYTSGLRRGEVVGLTLGDYDHDGQILSVRGTKFYKSRLIPLSKDATSEVERYLRDRQKRVPRGADAPLLLHRRGPYTGAGLRMLMRHLFEAAGVQTTSGRLPRVHDLRFTFASHALRRWYRAGANLDGRLPALAIYMGHASVLSTQYYLPVFDVVAEEASEKFDRHCTRFLSTASGEGDCR